MTQSVEKPQTEKVAESQTPDYVFTSTYGYEIRCKREASGQYNIASLGLSANACAVHIYGADVTIWEDFLSIRIPNTDVEIFVRFGERRPTKEIPVEQIPEKKW